MCVRMPLRGRPVCCERAMDPTTVSEKLTIGMLHPPLAAAFPSTLIPNGLPSGAETLGGHVTKSGGGGVVVEAGVVVRMVVVELEVVVVSVREVSIEAVVVVSVTGGAGVRSTTC